MSETGWDKAIATLKRDGWCRGRTTNNVGEHCAYGALAWVGANGSENIKALADTIIEQHPELAGEFELKGVDSVGVIVQYNDWHAEGAEDIISLMEKAKNQ